jgi:hypothetical protein
MLRHALRLAAFAAVLAAGIAAPPSTAEARTRVVVGIGLPIFLPPPIFLAPPVYYRPPPVYYPPPVYHPPAPTYYPPPPACHPRYRWVWGPYGWQRAYVGCW